MGKGIKNLEKKNKILIFHSRSNLTCLCYDPIVRQYCEFWIDLFTNRVVYWTSSKSSGTRL